MAKDDKEKTYTFEVMYNTDSYDSDGELIVVAGEWVVITDTLEDEARLKQHAHVADVRELEEPALPKSKSKSKKK